MYNAVKFLVILVLAYVVIERPYTQYLPSSKTANASIPARAPHAPSGVREDASFYYVSQAEMNHISNTIFANMQNSTPNNIVLSDGTLIQVRYTQTGICPRTGRPNYSASTVKPTLVR